jgi:type VI protein secretion system component VasK
MLEMKFDEKAVWRLVMKRILALALVATVCHCFSALAALARDGENAERASIKQSDRALDKETKAAREDAKATRAAQLGKVNQAVKHADKAAKDAGLATMHEIKATNQAIKSDEKAR